MKSIIKTIHQIGLLGVRHMSGDAPYICVFGTKKQLKQFKNKYPEAIETNEFDQAIAEMQLGINLTNGLRVNMYNRKEV